MHFNIIENSFLKMYIYVSCTKLDTDFFIKTMKCNAIQ